MATIQERLNKMKNSGPAISSNVREFQDTRTEEEKRAVNQAARDRASGKVMSSLETQRRQAQVDMDVDTMNALDARMKAIRASAGRQTFGDRASDALSTAVASTVSGGVNFAGLMMDSLRNLNTAALEQKEKVKVAQDNIARYTEMMKTATGAEKEQLQKWIASNQRTINAAQSTLDTWNKPTDHLVQSIYQIADKAADDSERAVTSAKQGLGKVGQLAVDVGVAGLQMGGDALAGGLPAMFVRATGGAAQEARQSGADLDQQLVYGLGSGALSAATEKIANVAGPFKKVFGEGLANKAAGKLIAKFGENQAVQVMTRLASTAGGKAILSAISEGSEEVLEDLVQPYLKRATYASNPYSTNKYGAGNVDLTNRPQYQNEDGSISTVDSVSFNIDGKEVLLPTVWIKDGNPYHSYNDAEILQHYYDTGEYLGKFNTPEEADEYAQKLHESQNQYYNVYKNATFNAQEAGHDFLIGALLGGLGSGVEVASNIASGKTQKPASFGAGERPVQSEGNSMGAPENAVQGVSDANNAMPKAEAKPVTLEDILFGGKRVDMNKLTAEQAQQADAGNTAGTIGMDADSRLFQIDPAQHIDQRGAEQIADRRVNAFQYDHPQLHAYYKGAAESMLTELNGAVKGGETQTATGEYGQTYSWRNKRNVSPRVASLLDGGMTYADIETALDAIIHDKGQENYANAKRVEMVLDDMLTNGYNDGTQFVPANQQYIAAKDAIAGSQADIRGHGLDDIPVVDGLGNANAGTVNTAFDDMQARSDTFHTVNPNSAQRIMNDQQRAPSEVPTVNPDTGKNIEKTVSTILNSPLTSPEMATQIESSVADGRFDYIPVTDRDANLRAQQDLSNRGLQTVADSFIAKVELGQRITKNDTASAIAAYNQAVADGNHALAFDLMTAIADAAHDSAQVVQSMNLMNRLTPEGRLLTLRKYVDKLNRKAAEKSVNGKGWKSPTQDQVDTARTNYVEQATGFRISDELAANYLMAETDAERAAAWDAITTDIASQIPGTFREKANFWRYTSMLLNPTTHVRNFLGNAIQAGARTIKNGVGAVIERAVVKDASQRTKSVVLGKEGKALRDFAKTQYDADKTAAMGAGKYSDASAAGINREIQDKRKAFQGSNPLSKAVQAVGDFNTRLLDLGDVIFNKSAYVDSFAQALKAKGVTAAEAAGGSKADLVAQARAYAIEEAQKATYRNTTALSEALSKMGRYEGDNAFLKAMSVAADAFMPFRRTPANILTTGIDYSPVGLTKAITYDAYQVKAGNMSAADMVDHLSAGLTGTGILALGAYLAAEGLLKVRTGDDDREKDYNKDRGMQDYSLQIGDKSYTLDWAVPAAMPLFAGAAIMESAGDGGSSFDAVMDAIGGISEVVLETSMLSSLNDLISNWSYADNKALYLIDRTATSYAGQYVPTVGGKIASAMDDTVRKSYVEKGTGQLASDLGYFAQSMEKKIPGARETLQPKVDLWGNEVSNGEVGDRLLQSFLSPGYFKTVDTGDIDKELRRLAEATGSSAVYPAEVEKSFKVGGETKNLTAEEYTKYAKAVGQARYQAVSALTGNSGYKKLTDEEKAKAVAYAYEYATVKGKQAVSGYKPGDSSFAKGAMNSVLPIDSYILYKITADKDGNGRVSGTESAKALQSMSGLTDKQRWQEWARLNDAKDKADKASTAGLTVGEYASMKEKADANGDGRVTKEEAMKALGSVKNRVDLWDIICTTSAKNPYK